MKIISTIVCDRDGCYHVLSLFSGWLNGRISRQVNFCTGSGFTRTSILDLLQFKRKLQIYSDFEKWETSLYVTQWINVTIKSIKRKYFFYKQAALAHSCLKPFHRFHEITFFGRSRTIMIHISKKTTVKSSNSVLFRWTKIFPFNFIYLDKNDQY